MEASSHGLIARSDRELLAKEWLLRMIERTPLPELGELPVSWIAAEAPPLIAEIAATLAEPAATAAGELEPEERRRGEMLRRLREGPRAAEQIPRDLAALQLLMIESIRREIPERHPGDFAAAVGRLAEAFGRIQGAVTRSLVEERSGGAGADPLTGLPGPAALDEWLRVLVAEHRRYGHRFALAMVDIDGLRRINDAYGHDAGDRMIAAIAGVIRRQVRSVDQAFRLEGDEFAIVAPHQDTDGLLPLADRIATVIEAAQAEDGPRIAIAAGVVSCPADGDDARPLLDSAHETTYSAKASGRPVASARNGSGSLQDR